MLAHKDHGRLSGLTEHILVSQGAANLLKHLNKYFDESSSKLPRGTAEFCFNKGHELVAGVQFQPQNSGYELTRAGCLIALEHNVGIAQRLRKAYPDDHELQQSVDTIATKYADLSALLLPLTKSVKSQRKLEGEEKVALQKNAVSFHQNFQVAFPEAGVYNKLHGLMHIAFDFIEDYGMCGRCDAEGFESFHQDWERMSDDFARIPSTRDRVDFMSRPLSTRLDPEVQEEVAVIRPSGDRRGKYKEKERVTRSNETLPENWTTGTALSDFPEGCVVQSIGGCIKESWLELANLAIYGKVPMSWQTLVFACEGDNLRSVVQFKSEYIK